MSQLAVKVALALHRAIVLAIGLVELDAYPFTGLKVGGAQEPDRGMLTPGQLDDLTDLVLRNARHGGRRSVSADASKG